MASRRESGTHPVCVSIGTDVDVLLQVENNTCATAELCKCQSRGLRSTKIADVRTLAMELKASFGSLKDSLYDSSLVCHLFLN